jgi:ATP-binding cassette subfamily B protein
MKTHDYREEKLKHFKTSTLFLRIIKLSGRNWPLLAGFLVSIALFAISQASETYLLKNVIDIGIAGKDLDAVFHYMMLYFCVICANAVFVFGFIFFAGLLGEKSLKALRQKMLDHILTLSFSYFDRTSSGWLLSRMTSDASRITELLTWMFVDGVWGIMNVTAAMVFMFIINWQLALLVLIILPILIVSALKFKSRIFREYRIVRALNSKITSKFSETISGVRVIKSLGVEEKNAENFGHTTNSMYNASFKAGFLSALFLPAVQLTTALGVCIVMWAGGFQFESGFITVGGIKAFISYIVFMLWPIQDMARVYANMQRSLASAERVFTLLDSPAEIVDRKTAQNIEGIKGKIEFKNIHFSYRKNVKVLKNFNLTVRPGEMIALVGPTGGGKTTITNLIPRFYEPQRGKILIDGVDYRKITQASLQDKIGIVLQTPHLFSGTIMENISYGCPDAKKAEIIAASKSAHAHDFIVTLADKYESEVGEGGSMLSVGQRQLVSIARCLLNNPDVIILDEATSSIDTLTEHLIQMGLEALLKDRTSFVVAHRLSTIRNADRILVIEDGVIKEQGSHEKLMAKKGHYYTLYTHQFQDELLRA